MGEKILFQPLTKEDKITVVLYRTGIVLATIAVSLVAYVVSEANPNAGPFDGGADFLLYGLYAAVGMTVFFIHLYVGVFKKYLKNLYYLSLACLAVLLAVGNGSPVGAFAKMSQASLLLLPLSGCLGFVTAKEAFCFKLVEGYLLAMIMPAYLVLVAAGILSTQAAAGGLMLIAALLIVFTIRKVFMPLAWDIGDKSAYR